MEDIPRVGLFESPLEYLESILNEEEIKTEICSEEDSFEVLYASLGHDTKERPYVLQMYYLNDAAQQMEISSEEADAYHLKMTCVFPFRAQEEAFMETSQAVFILNRILPLGLLTYSLRDQALLLEHTLSVPDQEMEEDLFMEVFSLLTLFTLRFAEVLELVSQGEKTHEDVIEELKEDLHFELPSVLPFPGFPKE